jgi:hypothetical protein
MVMPRKLRLALAAVCLSLLACHEGGDGAAPGLASLVVRSQLPADASLVGTGLEITQVVFTVIRPPSSVVLTRTVPFALDSIQLRADLSIVLNGSEEQLTVRVDYQNSAGRTLFSGSVDVTVSAGTSQTPPPIQTVYQGPGGNVDTVAISPRDPQLATGAALTFSLSAFDNQRAPVPPESVYVGWRATSSSAAMNATGALTAPVTPGSFWVVARTPATTNHPNGLADSTQVTVVSSGIVIQPDSVEKLPGGTQQFTVVQGPGGPYIWSVNGADGGGRTFGTIDSSGFYTAPAITPGNPKISVCARQAANPQFQGCAVVVISPVPTQGADVVVFNDINLFDETAMATTPAENRRLVQNLVNFTTTGSRNGGTVVVHSYANGSECYGTCNFFNTMDSVMSGNGFTLSYDTASATLVNVPSNVKVIFLWTPTVDYTVDEINGLKAFAAQGGRIVFVGENSSYYSGIPTQTQFLLDMGAQMTNTGAQIDCGYVTLPDSVIVSTSPIMAGIGQLTIACASIIDPGPNDFVLFYDTSNTVALAGVAKIDLTPLPAPPVPIRSRAVTAPRRVPAGTPSGGTVVH